MKEYKIVANNDQYAVQSRGYYGEYGRAKAQGLCDSGACGRYWMDKEQAAQGFRVVEQERETC